MSLPKVLFLNYRRNERISSPNDKIIVIFALMVSLFLFVHLGCAPRLRMPPEPEVSTEPTIRVAVIQEAEEILFGCGAEFVAVNEGGLVVFAGGTAHSKWRVRRKYGQPASLVYRLVLYEEIDEVQAQNRKKQLTELGWHPQTVMVGKKLCLADRLLNDNRQYWVTVGPWASQHEASSFIESLPAEAISRVVPELTAPPLGALDLVDPEGRVSFSSAEAFTLLSAEPGSFFTIYDVPVGRGFSWERLEDRTYRGQLEFRIGNDGLLLAINELPLEMYLQGTLPKEMNPSFPPAALRAQAIAARSYTIARWGIQHRLDPFDFCADVHCQAYAGVGLEHPLTNQAVEETRGLVMVYQDRVCETYYSAVCGGHTEENEHVWGGVPIDYLRGVYDLPSSQTDDLPTSLGADEEILRSWIDSAPQVFCNHLSEQAPQFLHYTRKYFRWSFTYSRQELEEILMKKLEEPIGHLLYIIPIQRGVSGRCAAVRIVGDRGELTVERELNIRRALSPTYLPSACFVVERQIGSDGLPTSFTFQGAGWGHGVGMCQAGAAAMALQGYGTEDILSHYYRGASLRQIYGTLF